MRGCSNSQPVDPIQSLVLCGLAAGLPMDLWAAPLGMALHARSGVQGGMGPDPGARGPGWGNVGLLEPAPKWVRAVQGTATFIWLVSCLGALNHLHPAPAC